MMARLGAGLMARAGQQLEDEERRARDTLEQLPMILLS
jgi:hypothetical protein